MKISETCMKFREESIFDHPGVPKLAPGPILKNRPLGPGVVASWLWGPMGLYDVALF